jgi:hypothetical protein
MMLERGLSVIARAEQPRPFTQLRLSLMALNTLPRLARLAANPYSLLLQMLQGRHAQKRTK